MYFKVYFKGLIIGLCNCGTPASLTGLDIDSFYSPPTAPFTYGTSFTAGMSNEIK